MKKTECNLYIANIKDCDPEALYEDFKECLEPARVERIENCKNPKSRGKIILAGVILCKALSDNGFSVKDIAYSETGKPFLKGNSKLHFNMSHSGDYIVVSVSGQNVGVDIQKTAPYNEKVIQKITSEAERERLSDLFVKRFNYVWAVKESYSKLTGSGIVMDFSRVSFEEDGDRLKIYKDNSLSAYGVRTEVSDNYELITCCHEDFKISSIINVCL